MSSTALYYQILFKHHCFFTNTNLAPLAHTDVVGGQKYAEVVVSLLVIALVIQPPRLVPLMSNLESYSSKEVY